MEFSVTNAFIEYRNSAENNGSVTLMFHVENNRKRHKLCIGKNYIFTSDGFDTENRKKVEGRISLMPCHDLKQAQKDKNLQSTSIGRAQFFEETIDEFGLYDSPSIIWFDVYVGFDIFNDIKENLRFKNNLVEIFLDIDGLTWGWEPDNTHQIWGYDTTKDNEECLLTPSNLDVLNFKISFNPKICDE